MKTTNEHTSSDISINTLKAVSALAFVFIVTVSLFGG